MLRSFQKRSPTSETATVAEKKKPPEELGSVQSRRGTRSAMASRVTRSASKVSAAATAAAATPASPPARSAAKRSRPTSSSAADVSADSAPFRLPVTPKRARTTPAPSISKEPESPYVPPTPNTERRIHDMVESAEREGEKENAVLLHPELTFKYTDAKDHLARVDPRFRLIMDQLPCVPPHPLSLPLSLHRDVLALQDGSPPQDLLSLCLAAANLSRANRPSRSTHSSRS